MIIYRGFIFRWSESYNMYKIYEFEEDSVPMFYASTFEAGKEKVGNYINEYFE